MQEYKKRGGGYADDGTDQEATDENGRGKGSVASLENRTKSELYDMAQDREVEGRADMSEDDLVKALANGQHGSARPQSYRSTHNRYRRTLEIYERHRALR